MHNYQHGQIKTVSFLHVSENGIVVFLVCIESALKLSLQNDDFSGKFNFPPQGTCQLTLVFDFGDFRTNSQCSLTEEQLHGCVLYFFFYSLVWIHCKTPEVKGTSQLNAIYYSQMCVNSVCFIQNIRRYSMMQLLYSLLNLIWYLISF